MIELDLALSRAMLVFAYLNLKGSLVEWAHNEGFAPGTVNIRNVCVIFFPFYYLEGKFVAAKPIIRRFFLQKRSRCELPVENSIIHLRETISQRPKNSCLSVRTVSKIRF